MRFTLQDHGYPWKVICSGRKTVGKVWQHAATRRWHGQIGKHEGEGSTAREAFGAVASRALGYCDEHHLKAENSRVRYQRAAARARARDLMADLLSSSPERREVGYKKLFESF
jgi:hypothetical protein